MSLLRVAIVQDQVSSDLPSGLERTAQLARRATQEGARLVVFSETWLPGYPAWLDLCRDAGLWNNPAVKAEFVRYAENSVSVEGESGRALARIAAECGVALVVGVSERVERGPGRGTLYNALLAYKPDGTLALHHRKLMPTYTERLVWGHGDADGLRAFEIPEARVGGLVCWEHWMPLARQAMHDEGEDVHVALWPTVHEKHQLASRHYAFEGRCFVLAAGSLMRASQLPAGLDPHPDQVRSSDQWVMRGGSCVIGPDAEFVLPPVLDRAEILVADLDLSRNRAESMTLDVSGHYARPDCFAFTPKRSRRSLGTAGRLEASDRPPGRR